MAEDTELIGIPLVYLGAEDAPLLYANQFVIQHQQDEFILTVGQVTPPILLGPEDEQRRQAKEMSFVPVKVVARLAFNRTRLEELSDLLQRHLARFEPGRQDGE